MISLSNKIQISMNEEQLRSKIIDKILELPIDKWMRKKEGLLLQIDYNKYNIILNTGHGNNRPFISICRIDIYDDRIYNLVNQIRDHEKVCYEKRTLESLNEICYNFGII